MNAAPETPSDDHAEQLSRDEISAHYSALLANEEEAQFSLSLMKRLVFAQDLAFLNEVKPLIDADTEEYQGLLLDIFNGREEELIRDRLAVKAAISGISYDEARAFLASFRQYIGKGIIRKPKKVLADPQKLTALYRVTEALQSIKSGALDRGTRHGSTSYIANKELVAFIFDNAQHVDTIVNFILTESSTDTVAIQFVLDGGVPALSSGVL